MAESKSTGLYVSMLELYKYVEGNNSTRNIVEGERIINSGLIVKCGLLNQTSEISKILGLCLQTSGLKSVPHSVNVTLTAEDQSVKIAESSCTCKAGASSKCKHICAILIYCNRNDVTCLEHLSSTDVTCLWNKNKKEELQKFEPTKLHDFCHINYSKDERRCGSYTLDMEKEFLSKLVIAAPNSSFAKHIKGRASKCLTGSIDMGKDLDTELRGSIDHLLSLAMEGQDIPITMHEILPEYNTFYVHTVCLTKSQCIDLCTSTCNQSENKDWHMARKLRITGSNCYSLYTYGNRANQDWNNKIVSYLDNRNFKGNKYTEYGTTMEAVAREEYVHTFQHDMKCLETGIVILPNLPWLGFSPDGIILKDGKPHHLLEIKCPYKGMTMSVYNLVKHKEVRFLEESDDEQPFKLKKKHSYYAQCQLGLAILNLQYCDFVVYSAIPPLCIIKVEKDDDFISKLISKLSKVYFQYMLPVLCNRYQELRCQK